MGSRSGLILCLGAGCVLSAVIGQDGNWDLQNYHLYNPFALLNGRFAADLMPAGPQSFFNPLLDVPYYVLAHDLLARWPRVVAALAGLPYGLMLFLTWRIAGRTLRPGAPALIATAVGVSGTTVIAEIGTTFGDLPTADLMLGGLLCVLIALQQPHRRHAASLAAGALAGAAIGLKPTNAVLAPALLLALVLPVVRQPRGFLMAGLLFGLGGLAAVAVTYGWWAIHLSRSVGNPVAPLFNQIFRSPWFPPADNSDHGFMPHGALEAIFYPFYWLSGRKFVVSEISFRDARFAAAYLAVLGLALVVVLRRHKPALGATALLVFFSVGYVLWEAAFSIIRYAVALEALSGCVLMLALAQLPSGRPARLFAGVVIVFILGLGNYADWGRIRHLGATVLATPEHFLPPDSLVVITDAPRGFMAVFLRGPDIAFIGLAGMAVDTRMWTEAQHRIASHDGPIYLLNRAGDPGPALSGLGLQQAQGPCEPLPNPYQHGLELCPATKTRPA